MSEGAAMRNDLREALEQCKEALDSVWAAIGDALCSGNGIEKGYANAVANEARKASDTAKAALAAAGKPEQAPQGICSVCGGGPGGHYEECYASETTKLMDEVDAKEQAGEAGTWDIRAEHLACFAMVTAPRLTAEQKSDSLMESLECAYAAGKAAALKEKP